MSESKKCWACKRTLVGKSKLGLCPECLNKYGTSATAVGVLGIGVGVKQLIKHSEKILKVVAKIVKG